MRGRWGANGRVNGMGLREGVGRGSREFMGGEEGKRVREKEEKWKIYERKGKEINEKREKILKKGKIRGKEEKE